MLREREEVELREAFQNLRNEDSAGVPDFGTLWERASKEALQPTFSSSPPVARRRRIPRPLKWAGPLLAAASAVGIFLVSTSSTSDNEFVQIVQAFSTNPAGGAWRSPTDALLEFPAGDFLSTVPAIEKPYWLPNVGAGPSRNES